MLNWLQALKTNKNPCRSDCSHVRCAALTQRLGSDGGLWGSATGFHPAPPEVKQSPLSAQLGAGKGVLAARNFLRTFPRVEPGERRSRLRSAVPVPEPAFLHVPTGLGPHAVRLYHCGALITRHRGQAAPRGPPQPAEPPGCPAAAARPYGAPWRPAPAPARRGGSEGTPRLPAARPGHGPGGEKGGQEGLTRGSSGIAKANVMY